MRVRIRQEAALSDRRVTSCFKYRELFQILPLPEDAPSLEFTFGHHPFLMEFSYMVPDVSETRYNPEIAPQMLLPMIDREASSKPKNEVLLLLSTFSRHLVFQYNMTIINQQWFVKLPMNAKDVSASYDSVWGQPGYQSKQLLARVTDAFSTQTAPAMHLIEPNEYFNSELPLQYVAGRTLDEFSLPEAIFEYLDKYYSMTDQAKKAFLSACSLLRQGIQLFILAPSLAFAAYVSSLEALIAHDHQGKSADRCECCNQLKYHVRQRFLDFIRAFGDDSPEGRKQADKVYARRSAILHEGQLFLGEIEPRTMDSAVDWANDDQSRRNVIRFFRICLINWLVRHTST